MLHRTTGCRHVYQPLVQNGTKSPYRRQSRVYWWKRHCMACRRLRCQFFLVQSSSSEIYCRNVMAGKWCWLSQSTQCTQKHWIEPNSRLFRGKTRWWCDGLIQHWRELRCRFQNRINTSESHSKVTTVTSSGVFLTFSRAARQDAPCLERASRAPATQKSLIFLLHSLRRAEPNARRSQQLYSMFVNQGRTLLLVFEPASGWSVIVELLKPCRRSARLQLLHCRLQQKDGNLKPKRTQSSLAVRTHSWLPYQKLTCMEFSQDLASVAKRKAIETWIPEPNARDCKAIKRRKFDTDIETLCANHPKRARSPKLSIAAKIIMQKPRQGSWTGKPRDSSRNQSQSLADTSSHVSASEDQSQVSTPSTITSDLSAFEQELRRRKIFDADSKEMSDEYSSNWEEIQSVLEQDRDSPESTSAEHQSFRRRVVNTDNEAAMMTSVFLKLLKDKWNDELDVAWQHDQSWTKCVPLHPHIASRLPPPKPNQAIGWTSKTFDDFYTGASLTVILTNGRKTPKSFASSSDNLHWLVFIVEGKDAAGQLRKARRQNLHNAFVMMNNFFELRKRIGSHEMLFERAMIMTMKLTAEVVQLNCHWASRSTHGDMIYYGRTLESWSLHSPRLTTYREVRRSISNAVEWIRRTAYAIIIHDLSTLETMSRSSMIRTSSYSQQLPSHHADRLSLSRHSSSTNLSFTYEQVRLSNPEGQPEDLSSLSSTNRRRKKTASMQENSRGKVSQLQPHIYMF